MSHVWGSTLSGPGSVGKGQIHFSKRINGIRTVGFTYQRMPNDWSWRVEFLGRPPMQLRPPASAGPFRTRLAAFAHLEDSWVALVGGADPAALGIYEAMP